MTASGHDEVNVQELREALSKEALHFRMAGVAPVAADQVLPMTGRIGRNSAEAYQLWRHDAVQVRSK